MIVRPYAGIIVLVLLVILYTLTELDVGFGVQNLHKPTRVMQIRRRSMFYPHHELRVRVSLYFSIPESNQGKVVDESNIVTEFTTLIGDQKFKIPLEELYQDHKRPYLFHSVLF